MTVTVTPGLPPAQTVEGDGVLVGHVLVAIGGAGERREARVQGLVLHCGGGCFYHCFRVSWFAEITVAAGKLSPSSVVVLAGTVVTLVLVTVYVVCVYVDVTAATAATAAVAAVAATSLFSVTVAVGSASPRSFV